MQQAAFKVCRVACREVCPPGACTAGTAFNEVLA